MGVPKLVCDLAIAKTPNAAGTAFDITVTNVGTAACPGPITVTDPLPTGVTLNTPDLPGWTCTGTAPLSCTNPNSSGLAVNASSQVATLTVAAAAGDTITNCATVSTTPPDANPANNTS